MIWIEGNHHFRTPCIFISDINVRIRTANLPFVSYSYDIYPLGLVVSLWVLSQHDLTGLCRCCFLIKLRVASPGMSTCVPCWELYMCLVGDCRGQLFWFVLSMILFATATCECPRNNCEIHCVHISLSPLLYSQLFYNKNETLYSAVIKHTPMWICGLCICPFYDVLFLLLLDL